MCSIECLRPICAVLFLTIVIDKDVSCKFINGHRRHYSDHEKIQVSRFDVQKDIVNSGIKRMFINDHGETPMIIPNYVQDYNSGASNPIEKEDQVYVNDGIPNFDHQHHTSEEEINPSLIEEPVGKYNNQLIDVFIDKGPPYLLSNEDKYRNAHALIDHIEQSPYQNAFLQSNIQEKIQFPWMENNKEISKTSFTSGGNNLDGDGDNIVIMPYRYKPWPQSMWWTWNYGKRTPRISELNEHSSLFLVDPHIIPLAISRGDNRVTRDVKFNVQSCWKVVGNDVYFCKHCPNECVKDTPTYLLNERFND